MSQEWWERELSFVDLGDTRRNSRMLQMVDDLSQNANVGFRRVTGNPADAKADYRFVENEDISPQAILNGMTQATWSRIDALPKNSVVLVASDTAHLNFTRPIPLEDMGHIGNHGESGLMLHTGFAISELGVPLGFLSQKHWTRDPKTYGKKKLRDKKRFIEKESHKWIGPLEDIAESGAHDSERTIVIVSDQESDVYDVFAAPRSENVGLLIRSTGARSLNKENSDIKSYVAQMALSGKTKIALNRAPGRKARTAHCEIRFANVELKPPLRSFPEEKYAPITLNAILIQEKTKLPGVVPLSWLLLTTLPVTTLEQALTYIRYYTYRWLIERYHFVLKSGCKIEAWHLETMDNFLRLLGVFNYVAWRLLWIIYQSRVYPEGSCEIALSTEEWRALYTRVHKKAYSQKTPPTIKEVVRWIALLGGFWGRKGDGDPGVVVLWRGMQTLQETLTAFRAFQEAGI